MRFLRPEHNAVAALLRTMDHGLLSRCRCWFGRGTEIVLRLGEYRLSKDVDFLCADPDGYRELRSRAVQGGVAALFGGNMREERAFRTDQYGIRAIVSIDGIPLRFEIVREGRIELDGLPDEALGVPRLTDTDRIAEKLLANADRCQDRATLFRDAVDLGMIALRLGAFPRQAFDKARHAYGSDINAKLTWAAGQLSAMDVRNQTADGLGMDRALLAEAMTALAGEAG